MLGREQYHDRWPPKKFSRMYVGQNRQYHAELGGIVTTGIRAKDSYISKGESVRPQSA